MSKKKKRQLIGTFKDDEDGVRPICCRCEQMTRSHYSCTDIAETAARLLGWAPSPLGFICDECLQEQKDRSGL